MNPDAGVRPVRRGYGRLRAAVLIGVHVLIGLHIAHWLVAGRSLAPLELNEVMHTLELGLVTAGFLLMATALVATAVFGRWFCGWACHVLALQDLCHWLMARVGIAAKPVRSRVLRVAPFVVMGYMFLWPQVLRVWRGEPMPAWRVAGQGEAWASFVTDDFWRNLPGPWITALTLLVCGFLVIYLLGSRAFCFGGCPYGALFGVVERLAPGRIRLRGNCTDCGRCTAACQSGIWVHEEVQRFGNVVDPNCLRDLDCVAACPESALAFGFGRPSGVSSLRRAGRRQRGHTWEWGQDLLAGAVMLATIVVFRGLYDSVPFLMAVGLGCAGAALTVLALRLWRQPQVGFRGLMLRRNGHLTPAGLTAAVALLVLALFWGHSALVRWHEFHGMASFTAARDALASGDGARARQQVQTAIVHHEAVERWGLWNQASHWRRLASLHALAGEPQRAEPLLRRILAAEGGDAETQVRLAAVLASGGRIGDSRAQLVELERAAAAGRLPAEHREAAARVAERLAEMLQGGGDAAAAVERERARRLRQVGGVR